jgi:TonB family protein
VNIKIGADGTIQNYRLKTSSGNPYFDSTVQNAIQATRILEPPPSPEYMDMDVSFSSEALSR